jgi:hypothetical protein
MGSMPMIMAEAVISTGRMRAYPASTAARSGLPCSSMLSLAAATTRMELAVAVPIDMIAPVKAGTEMFV